MYKLQSLSQINIELTSKCNKNCWMCGRRERERKYGNQGYGDINFNILEKISKQIPNDIILAFHNNGEPLLYPRFGEALQLFQDNYKYFVTNGKLLVKKIDEIIDNVNTISVSIIENDDPIEKEEQRETLYDFLRIKKNALPNVILRFVGNVDENYYKYFILPIARRTLHMPGGSVNYRKLPVMPEHGICQDLLTRLAIDRFGNVSLCVRFDPDGELRIGNIEDMTIEECWNSGKRLSILRKHMEGKRDEVQYCGNKCQFYGVPTAD